MSSDEHRFWVAEQFPALGIKPALQILESVGRNTAPAAAATAFAASKQNTGALLMVRASDHLIADQRAFPERSTYTALPLAAAGELVTFGISPREPATGFGCTPPPRGPHNSAETGAHTTDEKIDSTSNWRLTITKTRCRRGSRDEGC